MTDLSYNKLKDEKSAYLLQHKNNPVHWFPYGPEAIQKAKDENRPIFLSVGYSTCHWCHVMAHESFSDQETADYLNEHFVAIKVDREEHPDIDQYYQNACQVFIRTGGWPLNAFLLPDMRPFFVGTYYPKNKRGEEATFMELLQELNRVFHNEKDEVEKNATQATEAIAKGIKNSDKIEFQGHFPHPMAIMEAVKEFSDEKNGGYGKAPKFPQFPFYEWSVEQILEGMIQKNMGTHIVFTLEKMLLGGLNDHARGGMHRYSTDEKFLVPHFEKMLYDQAGLIKTLSKLSLIFPSPIVFDTLINTLDYIDAEMMHEDGYFFSAQDADSEGVEGLYFTFTYDEFESLINKASDNNDDLSGDVENLKKWFQITKEGNFEQGLNVISLSHEHKKEFFTPENWQKIRRIRNEILQERKQRIPPMTDNKGIASWNALMITALCDAFQFVQIDVIKRKAHELLVRSAEGFFKTFLLKKDNEGMMLRHATTKNEGIPYLEDYVTFSEAMLRLYEVTGNPLFKSNFKDTMNFIFENFVESNELFTRPIKYNEHELYPNLVISSYDQSFKSMASTLIILIKRGRALFLDPNFGEMLEDYIEESKHANLKNPISSGEGLRAQTYPHNAFRVIKLPKKWLKEDRFLQFMQYFLSRFVLDYSEERDQEENYEICNLTQCELQGNGLDHFISTLRPSNSQETESKKP